MYQYFYLLLSNILAYMNFVINDCLRADKCVLSLVTSNLLKACTFVTRPTGIHGKFALTFFYVTCIIFGMLHLPIFILARKQTIKWI